MPPQAAAALVLGALAACQQSDQLLPFDLDEGQQTASIGPTGGHISLPPSFSLEFPTGSLAAATNVTAAERLAAFPSTAGFVVPNTAFDVGPAGTQLGNPARVQIAVPTELLDAGEELALAVGLLSGGNVVTQVTSYDLTSGLLTADIDELGPVAAVINADAIPIGDLSDIQILAGGSFAPPVPAAAAVGAAQTHVPGTVTFSASCSTLAQQCFASGIVQLYVDDVVRNRLGVDMILMNATVSGSVEFFAYTPTNVPTEAIASLELTGDLRTRLNSIIAGRQIDDEIIFFTGDTFTPSATTVTFSGNDMTLAQTNQDDPEVLEYGVAGIGTGEQLTVQIEGELEFTNPTEHGLIVAQIRLVRPLSAVAPVGTR